MSLLDRARRARRMPPRVLARRLCEEAARELERVRAPLRARRLTESALLKLHDAASVDALWERLRRRPYAVPMPALSVDELERRLPGVWGDVSRRAEDAVAQRVDVLGTGPVTLDTPEAWLRDHVSGMVWKPAFHRRIDYAQLGRPSDVKVPWELSRLHWLIPAGQAYLLTGDERCATAARDVLTSWIDANPYAWTVNWGVAMEAALRVLSWTWLFHAFAGSDAWRESAFRLKFLTALHLHVVFVQRNLERTQVNGNHFTANAAGLVFGGLFFGVERWTSDGWAILREELPRQVGPDGVDFEMSTAYHRLVLELFLLPAAYMLRAGRDVPPAYRERVLAMAEFAETYARPDGTVPLWGDADDARALPLGSQDLGDHRYLAPLARTMLADEKPDGSAHSELLWAVGDERGVGERLPGSRAFRAGGVFVMRRGADHVFVDCGPVGLGGRGGHGHNDCLSFEAVLDGVHLVSDCGSYVYTRSVDERNAFRSTRAHNTPMVDGEEINRLVSPLDLWTLRDDAAPVVCEWATGGDIELFHGAHTGYERLPCPVRVERRLRLDPRRHMLEIADDLRGAGEHHVRTPFHLAPGVTAEWKDGDWLLAAGRRRFVLRHEGEGWSTGLCPAWVSASYGVRVRTVCVEFTRTGELRPLTVTIEPA